MGWPTRPEKTTMTLQIEVELCGVSHLAIDDCASGTVAALVSVASVLGKKSNVMAFPYNDNSDLWSNLQISTCEFQGPELLKKRSQRETLCMR